MRNGDGIMMNQHSASRNSQSAIIWLRLGNVPLTPVSMDEALDLIGQWAGREPFRLVVTPNVDHVIHLQHDAGFREAYGQAALSLADGKPLLWAARYLGLPALEKVSGSDLTPTLCRRAAAGGWRVFAVGGRSPAELEGLLTAIAGRYPGLDIHGLCPPWGFERNPAETERLLAAIEAFGPHLLLMGCGAPKSEVWMARHAGRIGRGVGIGIGAGLRFLAGLEPRAPRWMSRCGLEWSWRLLREPRRLWRRYLVDDMKFFPLVWRWKHSRQTRPPGH